MFGLLYITQEGRNRVLTDFCLDNACFSKKSVNYMPELARRMVEKIENNRKNISSQM